MSTPCAQHTDFWWHLPSGMNQPRQENPGWKVPLQIIAAPRRFFLLSTGDGQRVRMKSPQPLPPGGDMGFAALGYYHASRPGL